MQIMLGMDVKFAILDDVGPKAKNSHHEYLRTCCNVIVPTKDLCKHYDLRERELLDFFSIREWGGDPMQHDAAHLASIALTSCNGDLLDRIPVPRPMRQSTRCVERFFNVRAWSHDGDTDQVWRLCWRAVPDAERGECRCEIVANPVLSILFNTTFAWALKVRAEIIEHLFTEFKYMMVEPIFSEDAKGHVSRVRNW